MIDYKYEDLYYQDSIHKQLKIEVEDGTVITNEDIFAESMVLTENLCTDTNLAFGSCEASKFEIKIANQFYSMKGLWLDVSETLTSNEPAPPQEANSILGEMILGTAVLGYDGENWNPDHLDAPFVFGRYKVASDRPTADRSFRQIVAYDALYDIINADVTDVAEWYETLFPELDSTVTLKEFRDSFFKHFDIEQEEVSLPNDDVIIEKTISSASLSGKEVVTSICELNGCFGHIGRDGKFHYIFLPEISDGTAYALACDDSSFLGSPELDGSDTAVMDIISTPLSSMEPQLATEIEKENWQYIDYEDYVVLPIDSLQIRDCTEDTGYTYNFGESGNNYIIDGNILLYGKSSEELHDIAQKIFEKISVVSYRPTDATLRGNPCFEVGDTIMLRSKYQNICTYILSRTLTGIQALKDNYISTGNETYDNSYNSISYEVDQLKGITNIFERTVESNTLKIENLDGQVSTIEQKLDSISFSVTGSLGGTASIILTVGDEALEGDIDLSDVREAFADENSSVQISAGTVAFISNSLIVESDNFTLDKDGTASFKGDVYATSFSLEGVTLSIQDAYVSPQYNADWDNSSLSVKGYNSFFTINNSFYINTDSGMYIAGDAYVDILTVGAIHAESAEVDLIYCNSVDTNNVGIGYSIMDYGTLSVRGESTFSSRITIRTTDSYGIYYTQTNSSGSAQVYIYQQWSTRAISLHCGSGGDNRGIYDNGDEAWIIYKNSSGSVVTNSLIQTESAISADKISNLAAPNFRDPGHELLANLSSHTYEVNGKEHIGLTVDEVEESMKEAGMNPDDYDLTDHWETDDGEEVGSICYDEFIPILITEIQNLNSKVDELESELTQQGGQ